MLSAVEKKTQQALQILKAIGFPIEDRSPKMQVRLARIFLALCNIRPQSQWRQAAVWKGPGSWALRTRDIIRYLNKHYG